MLRYIVVGGLGLSVLLSGFLFSPPLSTEPAEQAQTYAAARFLSEPAQAGANAFGDRCSSCHGAGGQGSPDAPAVNVREYAADFRNAKAFHGAVGKAGLAHDDAIEGSAGKPSTQFNELELMGKFLREMRKRNRENS